MQNSKDIESFKVHLLFCLFLYVIFDRASPGGV